MLGGGLPAHPEPVLAAKGCGGGRSCCCCCGVGCCGCRCCCCWPFPPLPMLPALPLLLPPARRCRSLRRGSEELRASDVKCSRLEGLAAKPPPSCCCCSRAVCRAAHSCCGCTAAQGEEAAPAAGTPEEAGHPRGLAVRVAPRFALALLRRLPPPLPPPLPPSRRVLLAILCCVGTCRRAGFAELWQ